MENFKWILINKNRGWRGLAKASVYNTMEHKELQLKNIFSFSPDMWEDLIKHHTIVMQDETNYYIIHLKEDAMVGTLPSPTQQRSVLIKNYYTEITQVNSYKKSEWTHAQGDDHEKILHFVKNRNNHTTSDWNCIGIRVIPEI